MYSIAKCVSLWLLKLEMCQYDTVGDRYERKIALGIHDVRLFEKGDRSTIFMSLIVPVYLVYAVMLRTGDFLVNNR